jgi:hypothetical protein
MKPGKKVSKRRAAILLGALVAMAFTIACSSDSKPAVKASGPASASLRPAKLESSVPLAVKPAVATTSATAMRPAAQMVAYRSRDYGVSFHYPWQYAFLSAKAVANGDESRRPRSDGHDGQFTLARIEVPKGYYPETDFESAYFTLSLNQDLNAQECQAALPTENAASGTQTINGVAFRWAETDSGGHGSAAKVRNYAAFVNDACYELEMGVTTSNENGMAREIDPDQVFRRLEAILTTVKIQPETKPAASTEVAKQN